MDSENIDFMETIMNVLISMDDRCGIQPLVAMTYHGYDRVYECDGVICRAGTDGRLMIIENASPFCDDDDRRSYMVISASIGVEENMGNCMAETNELLKFKRLYVCPTAEGQALHGMGHLLEYSRMKNALLCHRARKLYGVQAAGQAFGDVPSTDEWTLMKHIGEQYKASMGDGSIYALSECASFSPEEFFAESFVAYFKDRPGTPERSVAIVDEVLNFTPAYLGARPVKGRKDNG